MMAYPLRIHERELREGALKVPADGGEGDVDDEEIEACHEDPDTDDERDAPFALHNKTHPSRCRLYYATYGL